MSCIAIPEDFELRKKRLRHDKSQLDGHLLSDPLEHCPAQNSRHDTMSPTMDAAFSSEATFSSPRAWVVLMAALSMTFLVFTVLSCCPGLML